MVHEPKAAPDRRGLKLHRVTWGLAELVKAELVNRPCQARLQEGCWASEMRHPTWRCQSVRKHGRFFKNKYNMTTTPHTHYIIKKQTAKNNTNQKSTHHAMLSFVLHSLALSKVCAHVRSVRWEQSRPRAICGETRSGEPNCSPEPSRETRKKVGISQQKL